MSGQWGRFLTLYGMSENGWIDSELYFNWFEKISMCAQPLNVSYFGPLKQHRSSTCHKFLSNNPGAIVTKVGFSSIIILKLGIRQLPEDLINSFHKTGVCPLNKMSSVFVSCHHMNRHMIVMMIRLY